MGQGLEKNGNTVAYFEAAKIDSLEYLTILFNIGMKY